MLCSGYALIYLFLRQAHNDRVGRLQLTATENHLSEVRVRRNGTFSCHHILIDKDKDRKERVSCNNDMQKNSLAGNRTPAAAVKTPNPSHQTTRDMSLVDIVCYINLRQMHIRICSVCHDYGPAYMFLPRFLRPGQHSQGLYWECTINSPLACLGRTSNIGQLRYHLSSFEIKYLTSSLLIG